MIVVLLKKPDENIMRRFAARIVHLRRSD